MELLAIQTRALAEVARRLEIGHDWWEAVRALELLHRCGLLTYQELCRAHLWVGHLLIHTLKADLEQAPF